ncbi:Reticulocalbin-2 [Eumeta japonica]|uniref:Reticulocalbin-3 n=1 Tax=Eumeta variegata TaxID=151549 RepID=A0A4C1ZCT2_EUMVA|nr:Reticulocalbin-2 [Eumeta japonica]
MDLKKTYFELKRSLRQGKVKEFKDGSVETNNKCEKRCFSVHSHNVENFERESDGSYRPRDHEHYSESGHNSEFDHEAILGSVKEAEEFDKLSPEEAKQRLALLLPKMDLNGDEFVSRKLSKEEATERMSETDDNRDGYISWTEYLQDAFGAETEDEVSPDDTGETGMLLHEEKAMWAEADLNGDGKLDATEFEMFTNPEEHELMHPHLINQTLREKDKNKDGMIDFQEFLGDRGPQQDKEWLITERDKFENEMDLNRDGVLDTHEIRVWVIPDNEDIAQEEVDHLFDSADVNNDGKLSFDEILNHHDVFVGSEATDYGGDLLNGRFDDEL